MCHTVNQPLCERTLAQKKGLTKEKKRNIFLLGIKVRTAGIHEPGRSLTSQVYLYKL